MLSIWENIETTHKDTEDILTVCGQVTTSKKA